MSHTQYPIARQRLQRSELAVPGSNPEMFEKAANSAADFVFLDLEDAVGGSDIVLSTARHEFQGLAVLEGVACGCSPVVPDAVVYPELFASEHRYKSVAACVELLATHQAQLATGASPAPDVSSFSWRHLAPRYQAVFESLCADPVL